MSTSIISPPKFKDHDQSIGFQRDLRDRFCSRPFTNLEIHKEYYAFSCCPSWLPVIIGNCKTSSIENVWNGPEIQEIRKSILDGSFRYCDHLACPFIQEDLLPKRENAMEFAEIITNKITRLSGLPKVIELSYDDSCNLACPSCRTGKIQHNEGDAFISRRQFTDTMIEYITRVGKYRPFLLKITGSGDPFASPSFQYLLKSLDAKSLPLLRIELETNGTMLTERTWEALGSINARISNILVSVDASTEETYKKVRRFGHWTQLQKNLTFIADLVKMRKIQHFGLNFVVQKENYHEMESFAKMGLALGQVHNIYYSLVNNWDTWSQEDYEHQCIWKTNHPDFQRFLQVLKSDVFNHPAVQLGNVTAYRQLALNT